MPPYLIYMKKQGTGIIQNPYSIVSPTYEKSLSLANTYNDSIEFSSDGTKLFVLLPNDSSIDTYTLSTPWDIGTAGAPSNSGDITTLIGGGFHNGLSFSDDGLNVYSLSMNNPDIFWATLSVPWDISTATPAATHDYGRNSSQGGLRILNNGNTIMGFSTNDELFHISLSTPYDITTAGIIDITILPGIGLSWGFDVSPDGSTYWVFAAATALRQYTMSTPFDASTSATIQEASFTYDNGAVENPYDIRFGDSGGKFYILDNESKEVRQYTTN